MNDIALLSSRKRTEASAYAVSMWNLGSGDDCRSATSIVGFYDEDEKEEALQIVNDKKNSERMPVLMTVDEYDTSLMKRGKGN